MTENNNGMIMPVAPYYGGVNGTDSGMFGGNWMWFLLVWMAMFGWGGNGFGGFGNGRGTGEIQRGFDHQAVMTGINGILPALQNGFAQAEISANSRQMADMNQNFAMQSAFQNCCCENRLASANLLNTINQDGAATRQAGASNTQAILDKLCQLELDGVKQNYEGQIRALQNQLASEQNANQALRFAASQGAQTAQILANNEAQTTALEQYLAPVPRPAYVVQNPNCCGQNYGCGCNGYAA